MQFQSRAQIRRPLRFLPSFRPSRPSGRPSHPPSSKRIGQLYAPSSARPLERADGGGSAPRRPVTVSVDKTTLHLASDAAWPRALPPNFKFKGGRTTNVHSGKQSHTATFPIDFAQPQPSPIRVHHMPCDRHTLQNPCCFIYLWCDACRGYSPMGPCGNPYLAPQSGREGTPLNSRIRHESYDGHPWW